MFREWLQGIRIAPVLALLVLLCLSSGSTEPVTAQAAPPAEAVAAAAALLEQEGYVARFSWAGRRSFNGELRYQSPVAYGLLIEDPMEATVEYLMLDPTLYIRELPAGATEWRSWRAVEWHPDVPIPGLTQYHPRLPLELLRAARELRDTGAGGPFPRPARGIEGVVSYFAAVIASYDEVPAGPTRQMLNETAPWPLTIWLDAEGGRALQLVVHVPPAEDGSDPAGTLTFSFDALGEDLALRRPVEAETGTSPLQIRPAPAEPAQSLPLTLSGRGRVIRSPLFVSGAGGFQVRLGPGFAEVEYQVWRVKRGRLLFAGLGTQVSTSATDVLPGVLHFPLAPGEYVVEIALPGESEWTLTIEELAPGATAASAGSGLRPGGIDYAENHFGGP